MRFDHPRQSLLFDGVKLRTRPLGVAKRPSRAKRRRSEVDSEMARAAADFVRAAGKRFRAASDPSGVAAAVSDIFRETYQLIAKIDDMLKHEYLAGASRDPDCD